MAMFRADSARTWPSKSASTSSQTSPNWKDHDSFEAAFARLLNDLKAEAVNRHEASLKSLATLWNYFTPHANPYI